MKNVVKDSITPNKKKLIRIHADGSCSEDPENKGNYHGGYGVILECESDNIKAEICGYKYGDSSQVSSSRMEILGVIMGLNAIKDKNASIIKVYTDQKLMTYVNLLKSWKNNNWMNKNNKPVNNSDLWEEILYFYNSYQVRFIYVESHNGNIKHERCDALAGEARKNRIEFRKKYFKINLIDDETNKVKVK